MLFFKPVYRPVRGPARLVAAFAAVTLTALAAVGICSSPAQAQAENQSALEMLQDGLDALADQQRDLAAQFFEQLIMAYPGTTQADRAEHELKALGQDARPAATDPVEAEPAEAEDGGREPVARRTLESIAALRVRFSVEAGDRVFFAENSAVIGGRARTLLESQARWLVKSPGVKITIIGRADDGGPADEAMALSLKRAETVRDKLVAGGVDASRISVDGRGTRDPIATCKTVICQAQNRHAETFLGGMVLTGADAAPKTVGSGGVTVAR